MSNLTNADISNYELINSNELGPFTLDEWIEYNNTNKLYTNNLLDTKLLVLTNYPRVKLINVLINEYKKNDETGIRKISYKITQHVPKKPKLYKKVIDDTVNKLVNVNNVERKERKNSREQSYKLSGDNRTNNWRNSNKNNDNCSVKNNSESKFKLFNVSENSINKINCIKFENVKEPYTKEPYTKESYNNEPYNKEPYTKEFRKNTYFTLVIKNIPSDFSDCKYDKDKIIDIFKSFGDIHRVNILNNRNNVMAFIDFYNETSLNKVLNSSIRFKLEHNILNISKKNSKQQRMSK